MVTIKLGELTRIEGCGEAEIVVEGDEVKKAMFKIVEGPRFFELLTVGRHYYDVPDIEARICGICYLSHVIASVLGIERALDVEVPKEVMLLRELGLLGEFLESHALHLYLLVAPDLYGYPDAVKLANDRGELVKEGIALMSFGNYVRGIIGGREIHGINVKPGGFGRYPTVEELEEIEQNSRSLLELAENAVDTFSPQEPLGSRVEHFIATDGYLYGDRLIASDGETFDYYEHIEEGVVPHSFAKRSRYKGSIFMVGALSRIVLKGDQLTPTARRLYEKHGERFSQRYIGLNNLAQAIELVYALERISEITKELLDRGFSCENVPVEAREGEGIGYVEAPRGVLVHHYRIDARGNITYSNIITPTAMNAAMVEISLYEEAKRFYGTLDEEHLTQRLEMTVRAFDPCISCSVHLIKL